MTKAKIRKKQTNKQRATNQTKRKMTQFKKGQQTDVEFASGERQK